MEEQTLQDTIKTALAHLQQVMKVMIEEQTILFRKELSEKLGQALAGVSSLMIGFAFLFIGLFTLVATLIIGLSTLIPLWAAALAVTSLLFLTGSLLVVRAFRKLESRNLLPTRSIENLKETLRTNF